MSDRDDLGETATLEHGSKESRGPRALRVAVHTGTAPVPPKVFTSERVVVGRSRAADYCIPDRSVSELHVELTLSGGAIAIEDLSSRNGTWLGSARVFRALVPAGTTVKIGATTLRLELVSTDVEVELVEPVVPGLVGSSAAMHTLRSLVARVAPTDLSVLVEGPTGAGKEVVARALHRLSRRADAPFIVLDCAAIPPTLAESLLFGHERGAFTGAVDRRPGVFEAAHGGTIFIDELGELPLDLQPRLLRVLEQREVTRVGSHAAKAIDVRVVSATLRDLRAMVNQATFREDLYYRLAQARLVVTPLDERREDVPELVELFLSRIPAGSRAARAIAPDALEELSRRSFPGNVRELRSCVERAAALAEGDVVTLDDLTFDRMLAGKRGRPAPASDAPIGAFKDDKRSAVDEFERAYLTRLIARTEGNLSRAAIIAGIERHHLRALCRRHGVRDGGGEGS